MAWRGSACIYQGEELGLGEADVAYEDLQDPYGIEFWPEFKGRDGCRTPMVWEKSNQNAGFSEAKPWLPVADTHLQKNAAQQASDPDAILHHYKAAIALRHAHPALSKGDHANLKHAGGVLSFTRTQDGVELFCAFNISGETAAVPMPDGKWIQIGAEVGSAKLEGTKIMLAPWQPLLAQRVS